MHTLHNIEFVTTVADTRMLPPARGAEVAFVGRSNAGKSSALNALAHRKRIAFVSKTPGRTQHINFFRVGEDRYLVDLPGYGYAAVPAAARAHWHELIGGYLQTRSSLRGVVLIMDARHPLTELDWKLIAWLKPTGRPMHVLLSKSDKLSRQPRVPLCIASKLRCGGITRVAVCSFFRAPAKPASRRPPPRSRNGLAAAQIKTPG